MLGYNRQNHGDVYIVRGILELSYLSNKGEILQFMAILLRKIVNNDWILGYLQGGAT